MNTLSTPQSPSPTPPSTSIYIHPPTSLHPFPLPALHSPSTTPGFSPLTPQCLVPPPPLPLLLSLTTVNHNPQPHTSRPPPLSPHIIIIIPQRIPDPQHPASASSSLDGCNLHILRFLPTIPPLTLP
ncbi:hypothetical protein EX30DRAFT_36279 [Ascodesmis nigricans]|uniref:Uncharacterized protein n=1 Tax=Ascodesmis nigricans TaxID=341454 RepID=A0A4S2MWW8_9PEZI|nr:hypothetical protein EX30DRAFT_36279 [Ascodesmis nigricans]